MNNFADPDAEMTFIVGRPRLSPEGPTSERIQLVATEAWLKRVDAWRRKQADLPNRSEAIRRLCDLAMKRK